MSLQEQYSLLCRATEWEVAEACAAEGVALLPWSPLKGGWLSGKMARGAPPPEGSRVAVAEATGRAMQSHPNFSQFAGQERVWDLLDGLRAVAAEVGGGATVAQVAIRWLLQKPNVPSVVIGAKTVEQLQDNLGALRFALTAAQVAKLDALSAEAPPYVRFGGAHAQTAPQSHTHKTHYGETLPTALRNGDAAECGAEALSRAAPRERKPRPAGGTAGSNERSSKVARIYVTPPNPRRRRPAPGPARVPRPSRASTAAVTVRTHARSRHTSSLTR